MSFSCTSVAEIWQCTLLGLIHQHSLVLVHLRFTEYFFSRNWHCHISLSPLRPLSCLRYPAPKLCRWAHQAFSGWQMKIQNYQSWSIKSSIHIRCSWSKNWARPFGFFELKNAAQADDNEVASQKSLNLHNLRNQRIIKIIEKKTALCYFLHKMQHLQQLLSLASAAIWRNLAEWLKDMRHQVTTWHE